MTVLCLIALALLAQCAAANPIQDENARPGDTRWRLGVDSASQAPKSAVEGYSGQVSIAPGETLDLHVRATARYRVEIDRLGWYGGIGGRRVACLPGCDGDEPATVQPAAPPPDPITGVVRAGWSTTDTYVAPPDLPSGYYLATFVLTSGPQAGRARWYPFVVRPRGDRPPTTVVDVPVNTWQAYSNWGGKSLYSSNSTDGVPANHVSFDRPLSGDNSPVFAFEVQVVHFLERNGYDAGYVTDVDLDRDPTLVTRRPAGLTAGLGMALSIGHAEYWTKAMRDAFDAARDAGRNLAFLGADSGDWQVRYEDGGRTLVEYRSALLDPIGDPALATTRFTQLVPPRPQCELLGVGYGGGQRLATDPPRDYAVTAAGARHPWIAGTGLTEGAAIADAVGYEWDAVIPGCAVPPLTPLLHWSGLNGDGRGSNADAVTYTAASGARVFSTGSLQFAMPLDAYRTPAELPTAPDPRVQALFRNVLDTMVGPVPDTVFDGGPDGSSNDATPELAFTSATATRFECRLDGAAWGDCTSPYTVGPLTEGTHSFEVRAVDGAGTYDASPASRAWVVDLTAPDTRIADGPAPVSGPSVAVRLGSDDPDAAGFECSLDGATFARCNEHVALSGLADGPHAFAARAVDGAGNTDASPALVEWIADALPPATPALQTAPASPANDLTPLVSGVAEGAADVAIYATADCSGPVAASGTGAELAGGLRVTVERDATTSFSATASDSHGNVSGCSASVDYAEDSTAPDPPANLRTNPPSPGSRPDLLLLGDAEARSIVRVYEAGDCSGPVLASGGAGELAAGLPLTSSREAASTWYATATDAVGNASACSDGVSYVEDEPDPTAVALDCTPAPALLGDPSRCTARVTDTGPAPSPPTGVVTFGTDGLGSFDGLGGCTLEPDGDAAASCAVGYTPGTIGSGVHALSAGYGGDGAHLGADGGFDLGVDTAATTTVLTSSAGAALVGQPVELTATVTSGFGTPTGTVEVLVDGTPAGSIELGPDGSGSLEIATLAAGNHTVDANYLGDGPFASSAADSLGQRIDHDTSAPGAPLADRSAAAGQFALGWAYGGAEPVTFTVERRAAGGFGWNTVASGVIGAGHVVGSRGPEPEGRWEYRVRADFADGTSTASSEPSAPVWVDRTPPSLTLSGCPRFAAVGTPGAVDVSAADGDSGLATDGDPSGRHDLDTGSLGSHSVTFAATDRAHNSTVRTCAYEVVSPYVATVEDTPGLAAYWRLGEASGSVARDSAGAADAAYDQPLTAGVPGALAGDPDTAVRFSGDGGRVRAPDLGEATTFTVEGFERIATASTTDPPYGNNTLYGLSGNVRILPRPGGVYAGAYVGGTEYAIQGTTPSNVGQWVHWALVRSGSDLTLYRDGRLVGRRADLPAAGSRITGVIGRQGDILPARADVDEVAVYRSALTEDQIARRVALARPPGPPGTPSTTRSTNTGTFLLSAPAAAGGVAPLTYTLEHARDSATPDWSTVASGLGSPDYTFGRTGAAETPGTWRYRIRAVDPYGVAGDWSAVSEAVSVSPVLAPTGYAAAVLATPGLAGYWRLGEPAGTVALDAAGVADGAFEAPFTLGVAGAATGDGDSATSFAGGRVRLPDLGSAGDFTVEGFERIATASTSDPLYGNNTLFGGYGNLRLLPRPEGAYAGVWLGGTEYWLAAGTPSNVGAWVHWALVRHGADLTLYRNGVRVATRGDLPAAASARLSGYLARQGDSYAARADIDEVAVYRTALGAAELAGQLAAR